MKCNQLKAGAILSYVSIILNMVVGLLYTPYMLRMLGKSEYGLYSLAASIVAYLTVLDFGFGNAIVRYTAKYRAEGNLQKQSEMFGMFLILYCIIGVATFIIGAFLAVNTEILFSDTMTEKELLKTKIMLWLMIINLSFTFPMSIWGSIVTAYERFVFHRVVSVLRIIANPLVMVVLLAMGHKAITMVVVTTIFNIGSLVCYWLYCKYELNIKAVFGKFDWKLLKEVSIFSFWIFLNVIMDKVYWSTGQFVIGMYCGAASIAVYALAVQLHQMYNSFSTAISGVFLPKVTAMVTNGKTDEEISDLFIRTGRIQYIIMSFILSTFIIFGQAFIRLWAGEGYEDTYIISLLFFVPLTVPLIQNLGITILQARNEMKFRSILYVIIAIFSLFISIPFTKKYGGIGCAIGTSSALIVGHIIIMNIYYQAVQKINILRFWEEIIKMSIVPLILSSGFIFMIKYYNIDLCIIQNFLLSVSAFSLIYGILFFNICMNKSERDLFLSPIKMVYNDNKHRQK